MKDFIGQTIEVGGWVAATGGGNVKGEYGSILYKVLGVADGKLRLQRLRANYPDHKTCTADAITTTVTATNKYIVVHPMPAIVTLFDAVVQGNATASQHDAAGKWVHGVKSMAWS
jgi:hypothetical protein